MSVIVLLIAAGGAVALGFLLAFIWAVRTGQYDDTATPAIRILLDDVGSPASLLPDDGGAASASGPSSSQSGSSSRGMPHVDLHR